NPGLEYENTRHNLGFRVIDELAQKLKVELKKKKFNGYYYQGKNFLLVKPQTYINNSGKCVAGFTNLFSLPAANLLVIYDDINLPLGSFRYRSQGSGGGHNGVNRHLAEKERREIATILPRSYQIQSPLPVDLDEAKNILAQQAGLKRTKEIIVKKLEIEELKKGEGVKEEPLILCLVGPSGTGKTTLVQLLAQAAQKKIYPLVLGGLSEVSWLTGTSEGSGGTEIGQLAKALVETGVSNPIILLEEIDKA
ncbi:7344_t:CDS:2, partial [Cetraspora pellucida]